MLLHALPTDVTAMQGQRPRHVDFVAIPRVSVWSWLGPVAGGEAVAALCAPSVVMLNSHARWFPFQVLAVALASLAIWFMAAQSQNLYRPLQGSQAFGLDRLVAAGALWFLGVSVLVLAACPPIPSRHTTTSLGAALVFIILMRLVWNRVLRARLNQGRCIDRALVMASDRATARDAADVLEAARGNCVRAAICMPVPGMASGPSLAWVEDAVCSGMVDQIYIVGCSNLDVAFTDVLPRLAGLDIDVILLSERSGVASAPVCSTRVGRLYALPLSSRAMGPVRASAKRAMDLAIALSIGVLLAPALALLALAIKLDSPGPVLFVQRREGLRGKIFRVFKFRTMSAQMADEAARNQTARNDARVTRFGRVLRRLSLDELPQLINVVRGDMSIVGPRPHSLGMTVNGRSLHEALAEYRIRHRVKPGITGWAQVNGCRGEVTTQGKLQQRLALDCEYIERCSIVMDGWIMLRTVATLLFDKHAY